MATQEQTQQPKRVWISKPAPKYTVDTAKEFGGYSDASIEILLNDLDCECRPYEDVFTYGRWKGLKRQVRKGEKAHRLPTHRPSAFRFEGEAEEVERNVMVKTTACVFCRCQTDPVKEKGNA